MATGDLTMRPNTEQLPSMDGNESSTTTNPETEQSQPTQTGEWEGPPRRNTIDLNYMHRPPTILPNYGKRKGVLKLKTNVPRVLLFDNVTQQTMLDVELTCIQSQRHKANRELSMQARSFMLRRQFKQRFLKNLTKVFHDDDYWEFEQEYFGLTNGESQGQRKEVWSGSLSGSKHEGHFLPKLHHGGGGNSAIPKKAYENPFQHHQTVNATIRPGRSQKGQNSDGSPARWSAADANRNTSKRRDAQGGFTKDKKRDLSLPHIKISPPQVSAQFEPSELLHFDPPGKIGFRFEKSSTGITRIFHAHDNPTDEGTGHRADNGMANPDSSTAGDKFVKENLNSKDNPGAKPNSDDSVNQTADSISSKENRSTSQNTLQKPSTHKNFRKITNPFVEQSKPSDEEIISQEDPADDDIDREFPTTTDQPTLDRRFKILNKLLVKQDPPNDGYIELSPSFARNGPVHKFRNRIRELHLDAGLTVPPVARDDSARSYKENFSQAATPVFSEHDHSESELEEEQPDHNTNDALRRLGGI